MTIRVEYKNCNSFVLLTGNKENPDSLSPLLDFMDPLSDSEVVDGAVEIDRSKDGASVIIKLQLREQGEVVAETPAKKKPTRKRKARKPKAAKTEPVYTEEASTSTVQADAVKDVQLTDTAKEEAAALGAEDDRETFTADDGAVVDAATGEVVAEASDAEEEAPDTLAELEDVLGGGESDDGDSDSDDLF